MNEYFGGSVRDYIYLDYIHKMYALSLTLDTTGRWDKSSICYYEVLGASSGLFSDGGFEGIDRRLWEEIL